MSCAVKASAVLMRNGSVRDRVMNTPRDEFEAEFADVPNVDSCDDDETTEGVKLTGDSNPVTRR